MPELAAGAKVAGRFTLVGRVGRGGMGEVWIARNESTGADVAIKVLRPDRRTLEDSEERFRHEARIAAKLAHPNVARVYDLVETDDGTLMLVMERLRGETLRERLQRQGALTSEETLAILLPICDALVAAHEVGVVHRDVTPGNVFLADEHGRLVPKLIDFGVAKVDDSPLHTKTGHALGTPQYMSPEQIRIGQVDGRSDEFSMAVTMYETMTATNPFKRPVASGSLAAVLETDVDPDARIAPALWLVLSRALSKQPYERYATVREMADALRAAIGAAPQMPAPTPRQSNASISAEVEVRRPSDSSQDPALVSAEIAAAPRKRAPWALVAGGVGLLVAVVVVAAIASRGAGAGTAGTGTATATTTATATATATATVSGTTSGSGAAATTAPQTSASAATAATTTGRPWTKPTTTVKPKASGKPVATTPGF